MLVFEALDAAHGDALLVQWGAPDDLKSALIDGGPSGTWTRCLAPRLAELAAGAEPPRLALVAVTHIDADHIDGVLRLLNTMRDRKEAGFEPPYYIDRFWHNSLDDLVARDAGRTRDGSPTGMGDPQPLPLGFNALTQSVTQGREARQLAEYLGLERNPPFGSVLDSGLGHLELEGLSVTIVGPRRSELEAQWAKWRSALDRKDYVAAAAAYTDPNVYNQASIVLLLEFDGVRLLLTGDARGDHLLNGLTESGLLTNGRMHVDILKVPHHGSAANADRDFFERVTADHYVVSANGTHGHPNREVLDWIADSRAGEGFTLHLTNAVTIPYDVVAHLQARKDRTTFHVDVRAPGDVCIRIIFEERKFRNADGL